MLIDEMTEPMNKTSDMAYRTKKCGRKYINTNMMDCCNCGSGVRKQIKKGSP